MQRGLVYACSAVGALLAAAYGYSFGREISGLALGLLLALNAGIFGGLLVAMALDWLLGARHRTAPRDKP